MLIIIIRELSNPNQIANQATNFEIKLKFELFKNALNKSSQRNFQNLNHKSLVGIFNEIRCKEELVGQILSNSKVPRFFQSNFN
jgi:hypothetical protein